MIISLEEAVRHLEATIPRTDPARENVLGLARWVAEHNQSRKAPLLAYFREEINVAYSVQAEREKERRNNFLVIKLPDTARHKIKDLQLDVYLGARAAGAVAPVLAPHPDMKSRRLVYGRQLIDATPAQLQEIFRLALKERFEVDF